MEEFMKKVLLLVQAMALMACSRPSTPPPVTPAQPPTVEVESTPSSVPATN